MMAHGTRFAWELHLLAGDAREAEREFRWGYETLGEMGSKRDAPGLAALLAEALYRQGRYEEAEELARACFDAASPEDIAFQVVGRTVGAKLLAVKGLHDQAERVAREAVALAEKTDDPFTLGQAHLAHAEVLLLAGRGEEAISALEAAADASERKGNVVTARQARAKIAELRAPARS
jgi:tetratricopeptide (TPR) repeat protein